MMKTLPWDMAINTFGSAEETKGQIVWSERRDKGSE